MLLEFEASDPKDTIYAVLQLAADRPAGYRNRRVNNHSRGFRTFFVLKAFVPFARVLLLFAITAGTDRTASPDLGWLMATGYCKYTRTGESDTKLDQRIVVDITLRYKYSS